VIRRLRPAIPVHEIRRPPAGPGGAGRVRRALRHSLRGFDCDEVADLGLPSSTNGVRETGRGPDEGRFIADSVAAGLLLARTDPVGEWLQAALAL